MQVGGKDYVQDGLIFMLDGIIKGENVGDWTDLIGGMRFINHGAVEVDDGFVFNGSEYMFGSSGVVYDSATYTIEVVIKSFTRSNWILCTPSVNGFVEGFSVCFGRGGIYYSKAQAYGYNLPTADSVTISLSSANGYCNKEQLYTISKDTFSDRNVWVLGARTGYPTPTTPRNFFKGTICAVRIYNRTLTAKEIVNNQKVDNLRFNLGL